MKERIMAALHDTPLAGHLGIKKMYKAIQERLAWKGLKEDIYQHVKECTKCQENKVENVHSPRFL